MEEYEAQRGSHGHSESEQKDDHEKAGHLSPPLGTVGSEVTVTETKPAPDVNSSTNSTAGPLEEVDGPLRSTTNLEEDTAGAPSTNGDQDINARGEGNSNNAHADKEAVDEHGDVVLETEEDTVIY